MVTVSEPDGQFETFRAGGERGERSWETVRETIPNGATGRVYATPRERETKLRAICDELGLNVREWQFKDLSRSYTGHPLLQRSRLYEPMYGYDGDGNYVDAVFEMYHGSVMSVIHSYGWTVTPPPDSMVAPEDAVLLAKAAVERKSAEIQSRGGTALEWPGDAQAKARSKLWYVRVVINDWISDEMRAHLGKKTLRLARSYSHADWFVLLDAETGHVLGGGQTIGYSPVAGRAGGPPGTERAQGPTLPPAGVLVAALCALAGVGAWIAVRRKAR
ncbi:MAG: hypothetical protein IT207_11865 [Fimbriimonadaceae bacterium]|nr:hypothetical protein [Fimbriimonadaceae bacterium]